MPTVYINVRGKELEIDFNWCEGGPGSREQPAESPHVDEILDIYSSNGDHLMPIFDELLDKSGWDYICKEVEGTYKEQLEKVKRC